jgi:hypothetical protein
MDGHNQTHRRSGDYMPLSTYHSPVLARQPEQVCREGDVRTGQYLVWDRHRARTVLKVGCITPSAAIFFSQNVNTRETSCGA